MKRRKFVVGLGSLAVGGAVATGTSAFESQEAERSARAKVKGDRNAAIQLIPIDDSYAQIGGTNSRTLEIKVDLQNDDALTDYGPLFEIGNRGIPANDGEDYEVYITVDSNRFSTNEDGGDRIVKFDRSPGGGQLNTTDNTKPGTAPVLSPGESVNVSMTLDTRGIGPSGSGDYKLFKQMTIVANEV